MAECDREFTPIEGELKGTRTFIFGFAVDLPDTIAGKYEGARPLQFPFNSSHQAMP